VVVGQCLACDGLLCGGLRFGGHQQSFGS
jgi:hypothetical protein